MELGSIVEFLENKSIIVTGATGFLAKIFIEKILRVQPNVKKLYLLLRAADTKSAVERFETEIIARDLFRVLRDEYRRDSLSSLLSERVTVVAGDVAYEDLGVKDSYILEKMWNEVHVVVNLAATTRFDERYDVALGINTLGARNVINFSKKCVKLEVLLHVSTAYVSGDKEGLISETPFMMAETLNGTTGLDINAEKALIEETLEQLNANNLSKASIKSAMKDLGLQRASKFGWPNTYAFTKAMGEMLLGQLKDHVPLVIVRPTIVTSTYKEPFPGWIEGPKTIDSFVVGYCTGKLSFFLCDPDTVLDMIPADMVVNAMIVAMVAQANRPRSQTIYHVGTSVSNPFEISWFYVYGYRYFSKQPWINKDGKPVIVDKFKVLNTVDSFKRYIAVRHAFGIKGLQVLNNICCQYFRGLYHEQCRKLQFVMRMMELYQPYVLFKGYYDDTNTMKLQIAAQESGVETETFYFDPKIINWEEYFLNTHFPGVVKHIVSKQA